MANSKIRMKLLVDTERGKVLFAEADKDCIDFLFHILSVPVGTLIRLLKEQGMVGCLSNLYDSVENLNETYIQPNLSKDVLLNPTTSSPFATSVPLLRLPNGPTAQENSFYRCFENCRNYKGDYYVSDDPRAVCPSCGDGMTRQMTYVAPPREVETAGENIAGGFVKGVVTYMVMDDLVVQPMSTISSITLLNQFNVKDVGALQENVVHLGINEALKRLKTSLQSKTVLTDVFLNS